MNTDLLPTNEYYHELLALEDDEARRARYLELFVAPWKAMMDMVSGGRPGGAEEDPLAGAHGWNWLLPHQTAEIGDLLGRLEAADAWGSARAALAEAGARFSPYAERVPFSTITGWLMLADPARPNPCERGYTGAIDWTQPRFVGQFWDPNADNLPRLTGLVAHEMHHLFRLNSFPWNMHSTRVAQLAGRLGGLSFAAVFVNLLVMLMLFYLVDWLIIDWLILGVLWRDLAYLPGTDPSLAGYHDWAFAFRDFLKGSVGILIASVVLGAIVSGAWASLA